MTFLPRWRTHRATLLNHGGGRNRLRTSASPVTTELEELVMCQVADLGQDLGEVYCIELPDKCSDHFWRDTASWPEVL